MPDLTLPYDIQPDDPATAEVIMAQFNSIATLLNSTGLDGDNIAATPAVPIPGSAVDLDGQVDTAALQAEAVTYAKIETPNLAAALNVDKFEFGSGHQISVNTETDIVSVSAPSAGFYIVAYRLEAYNEFHSGGAAPNTLRMNCKINGVLSWWEKERWNVSTGATDDLRHTFSGAFLANIGGAHTVKLTLTDAGSSYTEVDVAAAGLQVARIAAA